MSSRKPPSGPREGDEFGFNPKATMRKRIERLLDQPTDERGDLRAIGDAAGLPNITPIKMRLIKAGAAIRQDVADELTYTHTVLAQTCLPARKPDDNIRQWERQQGRAMLMVEAGSAYHPKEKSYVPLGLPYGPKARLILMHLNGEALRQGSPIIEVEGSLSAFVRRIQGRHPTGPEFSNFKEQLSRLSAATVRMAIDYESHALQVDTKIVGAFDLWFPKDDRQRVMWPSTVKLSLDYYDSLSRHAVPLDERAITALAHSAMALDVYCWLAQRLHRIPQGKPQFIPWPALYEQFGQGYSQLRQSRSFFLKQLRQVKTAYPHSRFDADAKGMMLWNSPPPIAKRLVQVPPPCIDGELS
jgi:hypothetical protein